MNILPERNNDYTDVTELLRFAQDYFLANPGQQMDLRIWEKQVAKEGVPDDLWVVQIGSYAVEHARPTFIPALAAITLGYSSQDLLAVMKHHGMDADDFLVSKYYKNLIPGVPDNPIDDTRIRLDSWTVCSAVLKAIQLDEDLIEDLLLERNDENNHYKHNYDLEILCLLSTIEGLWPISMPDSSIETSNLGVLDISDFENTSESFNQLSNEQILTILERSGNLHPLVISENGYSDGSSTAFFIKLFFGMQGDGNAKLSRIIEALNSVYDPGPLEKLNARIINKLPDFDFKSIAGKDVLEMMAKHLDKNRYAALLSNMVVKLNLVPLSNAKSLKKPQREQVMTQVQEDFECAGDCIMKHLYNELMAIEPGNFRKPHFKAIGVAINDLAYPQDLSGLNLQALLVRTLQGFDAYTKAAHWTIMGQPTTRFVEKAKPSVEALASYVSKHVEVDYNALSDLPSAMKAFLAGCNGYNIRKMPGISRHDKGHVLSDSLGL